MRKLTCKRAIYTRWKLNINYFYKIIHFFYAYVYVYIYNIYVVVIYLDI